MKAGIKLGLLVAWIGIFLLLAWGARLLDKRPLRDRLMMRCCKGMLRILGIRLQVIGKISDKRPLLMVSNHVSYVDVPILGSAAPVRFTPKSDVEKWPVIGFICNVLDCVFIDRRRKKTKEMGDEISEALKRGEVVSLFPEATTSNGIELLPFKSGFFEVAKSDALHIQPVAICYSRIDGLPIDSGQWPEIAWYGDMELAPHLWRFLQFSTLQAQLVFLPVVDAAKFTDRKQLAEHCQELVGNALKTREQKELLLLTNS